MVSETIQSTQEMTETVSKVETQLQTYHDHLKSNLLEHPTNNGKTEYDIFSEHALEYANTVLLRNDLMSDCLSSSDYLPVRDGEKDLKGKTHIGKIYCIDGRIARIFESFAINTWEKAAGLIRVEARQSDGKLIPSSSNLCESLKSKMDPADPSCDLLEIATAHYDSENPEHGCAAINLIRAALSDNKHQLVQILKPEAVKAILDAKTPEGANLILLEHTTIEATTNYYNSLREQHGFHSLKRVGIAALFDTATMGLELKYGPQKLSTTDLANKYRMALDNLASQNNTDFGAYAEVLRNPNIFLEFSQTMLAFETALIKNVNGQFTDINEEVNSYIEDNLADLTEGQKQALRFKILRKVSFQFLTGLCKITEQNARHPFSHHNEAYIAISVRGQFVGKYDLEEQEFGSSPADTETAISEIQTAVLVMDKNNLKGNETRIVFVCNSANSNDPESLRMARSDTAQLMRGIARNLELSSLIHEGKILPIPVILDRRRKVLEIPDHSAYF